VYGPIGSQLITGAVLAVFSLVLRSLGLRLARWISARDSLRKEVADNREAIRVEHRAINQLARIIGIDQNSFRE
jgi:hypothetical protein